MPDEVEPVEVSVTDLMPASWADGWVHVSTYRMHCLSAEELRDGLSVDLADVRCVLLWGGAPYVEQSLQFRTGRDGNAIGELNYVGVRHADEGPYLVVMTPWSPTDNRDDAAAMSRVQAAVALLRLALGPNIAVDHLGDLRFNPTSSEMQASAPPIVHPGWFGRPDISESSISFFRDLGSALERLEDGLRNRVELSLQWAFRTSGVHGADSLLMHWLMLETLAMPDSQNVTLLKTAVARAYDISAEEAGHRFRLGPLYGKRGKIVHDGERSPIHDRRLEFMAGLYWDLLLVTVGLPHRGAAARVLDRDPDRSWMP